MSLRGVPITLAADTLDVNHTATVSQGPHKTFVGSRFRAATPVRAIRYNTLMPTARHNALAAILFRTSAGLIVLTLIAAISVCLHDRAMLPAMISLPCIVLFAAYAIAGERVAKIFSSRH